MVSFEPHVWIDPMNLSNVYCKTESFWFVIPTENLFWGLYTQSNCFQKFPVELNHSIKFKFRFIFVMMFVAACILSIMSN